MLDTRWPLGDQWVALCFMRGFLTEPPLFPNLEKVNGEEYRQAQHVPGASLTWHLCRDCSWAQLLSKLIYCFNFNTDGWGP